MIKIFYSVSILFMILACSHRAPENKVATKEILVEAYTFGFPLVLMDMMREMRTNVTRPHPPTGRAPINQLVHHQLQPHQKLYTSTAWLDLTEEPLILELPEMNGKFYYLSMLDAWTNVLISPGKRTDGTGEKRFLITGPQWEGEVPAGVDFIRSQTNLMWIYGRSELNGKTKELEDIQDGFKLYPFSSIGKPYEPSVGEYNPELDMQPAIDRIFLVTGEEFFTRMNALMKSNPPSGEDFAILDRMAKIGISPGEGFSTKNFDKKEKEFLANLSRHMREQFEEKRRQLIEERVGWFTLRELGFYGTDYGKRALVAYTGLGRSRDEDAIISFTSTDIEGKKLESDKRYILHFSADEIPDVNAFFVLATYRQSNFLVPNQEPHDSVIGLKEARLNTDGSLDIYIQKESPGKSKESNWLAVPEGPFTVEAQFYWPNTDSMNDSWTLPPVSEAGKGVKLSTITIKE